MLVSVFLIVVVNKLYQYTTTLCIINGYKIKNITNMICFVRDIVLVEKNIDKINVTTNIQ